MSDQESYQIWTEVDAYLTESLQCTDAEVERTLSNQREAGLPEINVSPPQGKLLALYVQMLNARRVLEVGTLGGYSTLWMARALPGDGELITCELDQHHADTARKSLDEAGVADRVDIRVGPALDSLRELQGEGVEPFDLAFIDADKVNNTNYFNAALAMSRPGSVLIVDNVVRNGEIRNLDSDDPSVKGVHELNAYVASEPRVTATAIQTVGSKGYDGYLIAVVTG